MIVGFVAASAGNGVVAVPWQDIIAKSIPSALRGRFFGTMHLTTALATFCVGFLVRWALGPNGPGFPVNYTLLFTLAALLMSISTVGCGILREPIRPALAHPQSLRDLVAGAPHLLRHPGFRSLTLVSLLAFGLNFTTPFYIVYATTQLGIPQKTAGMYIVAAVLSGAPLSLIWGYINDHRGPRAVIRGACMLISLVPLIALAVPALTTALSSVLPGLRNALPYTFALVFLAAGAATAPLWMGANNYLFELSGHEQRPRYIALLNTLAAPRTLFPLLTGYVLTLLPYRVVFCLLALLGVIVVIISRRLPLPANHADPISLDSDTVAP